MSNPADVQYRTFKPPHAEPVISGRGAKEVAMFRLLRWSYRRYRYVVWEKSRQAFANELLYGNSLGVGITPADLETPHPLDKRGKGAR